MTRASGRPIKKVQQNVIDSLLGENKYNIHSQKIKEQREVYNS